MGRDPTWLALESTIELPDGVKTDRERLKDSMPEPVDVFHPDDLDLDETVDIFMEPRKKGSGDVFSDNFIASAVNATAEAERALQLQALANYLELNPDLVYYPGCRTKVTPSAAFPGTDILYLDIKKNSTDKLWEEGYEAIKADAEEFLVEEALGIKPDLIYMYDYTGSAPAEVVSGNEKTGQWIFADTQPVYVCKDSEADLEPNESFTSEHEIAERMETTHSVTISKDGYVEVFDQRTHGITATKII